MSALAQVLATGETTALLTCVAAQTLEALGEHLPLEGLAGAVSCAPRGAMGWRGASPGVRTSLVEWEAASELPPGEALPTHLVALDPPFRRAHLALLHRAVGAGSIVHLLYGDPERQSTARLLRYLVHPRFAMVCVYRAMQTGHDTQQRVFALAAEMAWQEAHVVLTSSDLARAAGILAELGIGHGPSGEAKLEARNNPAYAAADADFEECCKLCLNL